MYRKQIYDVKPEQLAAIQEKVQRMMAEGRRLDGTKPVKSWKELRDENHELQQRLEAQEDLAEDYKRRYAFAKQQLDMVSKEHKEALAQCAKYKDLTEALTAFIIQSFPDIDAPQEEPKKPESPEAELARIKARRKEYNRRYYARHKEKILENGSRWRAEHPGYCARKARERREAMRNEQQ